MVVADIAKLPKGAHPPIGGSSATQDVAAKLLNVSVRSGQRARYVKDHGTPDLVDAVKHGDVRVAAAAEFARQNPPLDQHRLIAEHGSPAAAVQTTVRAKADRAANKTPKPAPDPKRAADRAEIKAAAKAASSDNTLVGLLLSFERMREQVNVDTEVRYLSKAELGTTNALVARARVWIRNAENKVRAARTKFREQVVAP